MSPHMYIDMPYSYSKCTYIHVYMPTIILHSRIYNVHVHVCRCILCMHTYWNSTTLMSLTCMFNTL